MARATQTNRVSPMFNPPHPGEVLWGLHMEPAGLSVKEVAERMDVDRKTLSRVLNGHASISAEMALLLAQVFSTTPELWLNMQRSFDLWRVRLSLRERLAKVRPFVQTLDAENSAGQILVRPRAKRQVRSAALAG